MKQMGIFSKVSKKGESSALQLKLHFFSDFSEVLRGRGLWELHAAFVLLWKLLWKLPGELRYTEGCGFRLTVVNLLKTRGGVFSHLFN